jgi:two-component system, NtrC family, sensor kinase
MTLGRKIVVKNAALLVALILLACVATRGLLALRGSVRTVLTAYRQLQRIENTETDLTAVQSALLRGQTSGPAVLEPLRSADQRLGDFFGVSGYDYSTGDAAVAISAVRDASNALAELNSIAQEPPIGPANIQAARLTDMTRRCDTVLALLHRAASSCDRFIRDQQAGTESQFRTTLWSVSILSTLIAMIAALLSVWQYRNIVLPVRRLREGVRQVADGQFRQRVEPDADPEFAALAAEFNAMAEKLDDFYQRLEQKVAEKSRELVRSERLASVGFLAAGVAHEINNPLNIISGYAELSLKKLSTELAGVAIRGNSPLPRRGIELVSSDSSDSSVAGVPTTRSAASGGNGAAGAVDPVRSLQIIRDEAFRCKEITQKLLSLARGGSGDARVPVSLPSVAQEVATMVGGLSQYRDRRLILEFDNARPLVVMGNITEVKQVLLNLTVNALEATHASGGEVRISGRWHNGMVELSVRDNGRGMSRQTLERAFEPFYTERRGSKGGVDRGTGLGLTITHAIIESHGGQIHAESDGPGRGSRFVVQLPAVAAAGSRERQPVG